MAPTLRMGNNISASTLPDIPEGNDMTATWHDIKLGSKERFKPKRTAKSRKQRWFHVGDVYLLNDGRQVQVRYSGFPTRGMPGLGKCQTIGVCVLQDPTCMWGKGDGSVMYGRGNRGHVERYFQCEHGKALFFRKEDIAAKVSKKLPKESPKRGRMRDGIYKPPTIRSREGPGWPDGGSENDTVEIGTDDHIVETGPLPPRSLTSRSAPRQSLRERKLSPVHERPPNGFGAKLARTGSHRQMIGAPTDNLPSLDDMEGSSGHLHIRTGSHYQTIQDPTDNLPSLGPEGDSNTTPRFQNSQPPRRAAKATPPGILRTGSQAQNIGKPTDNFPSLPGESPRGAVEVGEASGQPGKPVRHSSLMNKLEEVGLW